MLVADAPESSAIDSLNMTAATRFGSRLRGLMFTDAMPRGRGLLISHCASVHTCFMRYAIDVVYLDAQGRVTRLVEGLRPWRLSLGGRRAVHTLELGAGSIRRLGIRLGDRIAHPALARES